MKKLITDMDVAGKRVFLRVDFNVPLDENGNITDDTRIVEELPTIKYLLKQGAKIIICSHLGRPDGEYKQEYSMFPVAKRLLRYILNKIYFAVDVVGPDAMEKAKKLKNGEILILENVRFHKEEMDDDLYFSRKLASMADIYCNDAFGTVHRKQASVHRVAKLLPNCVGFLMGKEVGVVEEAMNNPERPFIAVMGGAKISDKIGIIKNLLNKVDCVLIGGAMAFTFLKAQGYDVGTSLIDDTKLELAKEIIALAEEKGVEFHLPIDVVASEVYSPSANAYRFDISKIPSNMMALDIGPKTTALYEKVIKKGHTIIWNGPMGVFEFANFSAGTIGVASALTKVNGTTIVGGGDSAAAVKKLGFADAITHISTGGGASLKLLEGGALPGLDVIDDAEVKQ